ncbi:MAG: diacylglycerol kinase family protein [Ruminococcus sp.]|nr:diacylglycerol kinase family protein [Ruminococcus sp.]
MSKYTVLYNPKSNNGQGGAEAKALDTLLKGETVEYIDVFENGDTKAIIGSLQADDKLIIAGGDGSLNHFINDTYDMDITNEVFFFPTGSGNDFLSSVGEEKGKLIPLNSFLGKLPTVTVNGKDYRFINGVGYGIDGYCCEVGDKMRETTDKPINYTSIAIKGLLFHFKPVNAKVTVDGKVHRFKKVWLAPTMFGKYYGGGMIPTPDQKREDGTVSTMVYHNCGKLKALMVFPSIFKGEHVKHTEMISVFKGHRVTVEFDQPTALQIDGETILGVTSYTVKI